MLHCADNSHNIQNAPNEAGVPNYHLLLITCAFTYSLNSISRKCATVHI